eukprot:TRINITY_DN6439_c0_g1_i1.p1 TRINITY_DN6439_c0_g1~~TRINITY_DN6439_c0_g1_i1.p1  ORF type:complete len:525 (+),score=63.93 TRINITY_DN6439_c0_g1_i1:72-1646(+)
MWVGRRSTMSGSSRRATVYSTTQHAAPITASNAFGRMSLVSLPVCKATQSSWSTQKTSMWASASVLGHRSVHSAVSGSKDAPVINPPGRKRRLLILGCGWAGYRVARDVDRQKTDVTLVSPRNHFLFTPLLASTTVGTLEFRCIIEPVRDIANIHYYQASAKELDIQNNRLLCQSLFDKDVDENPTPGNEEEKAKFWLGYDDLVIATGGQMQTFGIKGVAQHAHFLKELNHARTIRIRLLQCFERANETLATEAEKRKLLHFVVVGGGPTGVEFAAELYDFLRQDVKRAFSEVQPYVRVTLVEASNNVLTAFDEKLAEYAKKTLQNHRVTVLTGISVREIEKGQLTLSNGDKLDFGLCVWSTGIAPQDFVKGLSFSKDRAGRIHTDDFLNAISPKAGAAIATAEQFESHSNIYAIGDCSTALTNAYPATAQVANQEGVYVAAQINHKAKGEPVVPFRYQSKGMLAYIGGYTAISDTPWLKLTGTKSWILWRSAYLTTLITCSKKLLGGMHWFNTFLFGGEVSQF